jgi:hypothetical protein
LFTAVKAAMLPVPLEGSPIEGVSLVHVKPVAVPAKVTAVVELPLQSSWSAMAVTAGVGCTVIVKVFVGPVHVVGPNVYFGVIVIVAVTGLVPALVATNGAIGPVPLAARLIDVSSLVQLYDVPVPVKFTAVVVPPLHTVWSETVLTIGVGLTVIVKLWGVPAHEPYIGVTVIVATVCTLPVLIAGKAVMSPVPLDARPMLVLLLVQLKEVAVPVKVTVVVLSPSQTTWFAGVTTLGVGFTVIVKVCGVPLQVTPPNVYFGVTVIVATSGVVPALVVLNAGMFPVPLAPRLIDVLSLVQS